jgi:hypothetical protein
MRKHFNLGKIQGNLKQCDGTVCVKTPLETKKKIFDYKGPFTQAKMSAYLSSRWLLYQKKFLRKDLRNFQKSQKIVNLPFLPKRSKKLSS